MNQQQETEAAQEVISYTMRIVADIDGVLPDDFRASISAILMQALEMHLHGVPIQRLLDAQDGS